VWHLLAALLQYDNFTGVQVSIINKNLKLIILLYKYRVNFR
jgi:hypothetical protein